MLKWIPGALIAAAFAASAMLQSRIVSPVVISLERLLPSEFVVGTDSVPRLAVLFGLPVVALVIWALLHEAPVSRLGLAAGRVLFNATEPRYAVFAPTYRLIVLWVVCLILSFHVVLLAAALEWPIEPGIIVGLTLGLGLLLVGNAIPRLRPNAVAGIRTSLTMSDPVLWARAHRTFGAFWLAGGAITIVTALAAPRYALLTGIGLLMVSLVAGFVAARPRAQTVI